ncbi:hypothetical protein OSB04_030438 [Centaurea solstitialis]|uniref:Equilibrative nucleoside transporter n=1 Tax=Centaurea solstitialis TaxID=347529 RepID=A0AA38S7K8_9ASTR|nr:hypothetical protein OSB04_030438 [Centaurea solstitialis]
MDTHPSLKVNLEANDENVDPKDTYNAAYIIHFLLGAGYLIPWNAFITAVDYFNCLYPANHINKVFSVGYLAAAMTVLVILLCWSRFNRVNLSSVRTRLNLGQGLFILALMVTPVTDWIDHGNNQAGTGSNVAFAVLVSMVVVSGLADGVVGGSLVGATGGLPGRYMQAIFAGNSTAGLMVSMLRIVTKASLPHTRNGLRTSTQIYFIFSSVIVLLCVVCTNVLDKLPVIQCYRNRKSVDDRSTQLHKSIETDNFWEVMKKIRWLVTSVFMIYVVSLSIFPGYLSENVESKYFKDWYPIILITTFNVGDLLGKCVTAIYVPRGTHGAIWCSMARVVFYPLYTGCIRGPKWMHTEVPVIVLTLMLGVTNGYLTSVLMINAPKSVAIEESEIVGITMQTFLVVGLVVGSVIGWIWNL